MAARTTPPFRADHVGSLLRPANLLEARASHQAGSLDDAGLRAIEDEAIREAVAMQESLGLQSATDGEFRRTSWHMDFIYQLGGIARSDGTIQVHFRNESGDLDFETAAMVINDRVKLNHTIFGDDFAMLRDTVTTATPKLTIPSPSMVHYRGGQASIDKSVYPDIDEFWSDLTAAYSDEIARLGELGCTYLQLDDTSLAYLNDPKQRAMLEARGDESAGLHVQYIQNMNAALASKPATMAVTTHMCRGNFRSSWVADGGYDHVAEALFGELGVDGYFMEWDDERSGGFEPLRYVPKGKHVVLGLITTKTGELESKDDVKRRIHEAAQYVDLDQLCLSGQCGFSSTVDGNAITMDDQKAKLNLIVEIAQDVWGT